MERQDEIVQRVEIAATVEQIWAAITEAEQLAKWFGDSATVDFRVGGRIRFGWSQFDDAVAHAVIERIEAPNTFAYRWWMDGEDEAHATLVTFGLTDGDDGTVVTVVESGLAALPSELAERTIEENSSGWIEELGDLVALLQPA